MTLQHTLRLDEKLFMAGVDRAATAERVDHFCLLSCICSLASVDAVYERASNRTYLPQGLLLFKCKTLLL